MCAFTWSACISAAGLVSASPSLKGISGGEGGKFWSWKPTARVSATSYRQGNTVTVTDRQRERERAREEGAVLWASDLFESPSR